MTHVPLFHHKVYPKVFVPFILGKIQPQRLCLMKLMFIIAIIEIRFCKILKYRSFIDKRLNLFADIVLSNPVERTDVIKHPYLPLRM